MIPIRLFIVMIIFSLLSCKGKKEQDKKPSGPPPPASVDVMIATSKLASSNIIINGTVLANEEVVLHPEVSGKLVFLNLQDGASVTKGTVLARINDAELQAQLKKAKSQFDLAQKTEKRLKSLLDIQGVKQADYDAAVNNLNNTEAEIEFIQSQIDKTRIIAPFNGTIGLRMVSVGAYVTPATELATMVDPGPPKLDFVVPQEHVSRIKIGSSVRIADAKDQIQSTARIIARETSINSSTGNLKVRAQLSDRKFTPGNFVKVTLPINENTPTLFVPTQALIPDVDIKKLVLVKEGKAQFVPVKTGIRTPDAVEIIEGLQAGDTVVVTGLLFVKPKADLKIRSVKPNS